MKQKKDTNCSVQSYAKFSNICPPFPSDSFINYIRIPNRYEIRKQKPNERHNETKKKPTTGSNWRKREIREQQHPPVENGLNNKISC